MSTEKTTEATLETLPQESLPWLESETWGESSMWQTDFQSESFWESDSVESEDIHPNTLLEQPLSSEGQFVEPSKDHLFEESQLVEVVEGGILLADPLDENPLDEPPTEKESFTTNESINLQEVEKEGIKPTDTLFDNFPVDNDSNLEESLDVENLPELENLNHEEKLKADPFSPDLKAPLEVPLTGRSEVQSKGNPVRASAMNGSFSEDSETSVKQIAPLNTDVRDLDVAQVKETEIQPSVEQPTHLSTSLRDVSSVDKNEVDLDTLQTAEIETKPLVEHSTALNTIPSDPDPDLLTNKNSGEAIAIDIPIHLVPIVKDLINLFEQYPSTKVQSSTFKNTFKHK